MNKPRPKTRKAMNDSTQDSLSTELIEAIGSAVQPTELSATQRDRMRQRILKSARDAAPLGTVTRRVQDGIWSELAPLVEIRELHRDSAGRTHTSLLRMRPGGVIPPHRHTHEEEFIVLEGECHIGTHLLRAGDTHIASAGSWHDAVTTQTGVLVLLRGEYPYPAEHARA